jgi:hypothetical protein
MMEQAVMPEGATAKEPLEVRKEACGGTSPANILTLPSEPDFLEDF